MNIALRHRAVPDSPLARWDARWKLAALVAAVGGIAALDRLAPAAVAFGVGLLLLVVARLPGSWVRTRLAAFALAALPFLLVLPFTMSDVGGTGFQPVQAEHRLEAGATQNNGDSVAGGLVSERGIVAGLAVFCRSLAIGAFALLLIGTAPLHQTLAAAHKLKVPGLLVLLALLAYRYAFVLADELRRLRVALWVRGFRPRANRHGYRTLGHVVGSVLVRGSDRAERVADAMRCRGFDGRFHALAAFRTATSDVVFCLLLVAGAAGLVIWDRS